MQPYLITYLEYNLWANRIVGGYLQKAGDDKLDMPMENSFASIRKTWYHIWDAQQVWILRLQGKSLTGWPSRDFKGTTADAIRQFIGSSEQLLEWGKRTDPESDISYHNMEGKAFTSKAWHVLMHVVNHGTYHRGQLVTLLRQAGIKDLQPLDLIVFTRQQ
jgi:uncharacterized damage-inducible protein DinB